MRLTLDSLGRARQWLLSAPADGDRQILASALLLFAVLATFKIWLLAWLEASGVNPMPDTRPVLPFVVLVFGADALTATVYAVLCLPLLALSSRARWVVLALMHLVLVTLLSASLRVNQLYGQPLNIRMMQNAGDGAVQECLKASVTTQLIVGLSLAWLAGLSMPFLARALAARPLMGPRWRLWGATLGLGIGSFVVTGAVFTGLEFNYGLKSSPFVHFVRTYKPVPSPSDFRREFEVARANGELAKVGSFDLTSAAPATVATPQGLEGVAKNMNLLVVLLESTTMLELNEKLTPSLMALSKQSLRFNRHITVAPFTFDAQYALFYSQLIRISGLSYPQLYAGPTHDTSLFEEFKAQGRATAMIESSYTGFLNTGWLYEKGVDQLVGAEQTLAGLKPGWAWGAFENDTVDTVLAWLQQHQGAPFAVVYNPVSPHHPYAWPKKAGVRAVPGDTHEDDYRNALHFTDTQVARVLDGLEKSGLAANTVVVVVSDHGESVGRGHGFVFTPEELWVPLWVRVPGHEGVDVDVTTSHLDFAPTLAGLFGLPHDAEWLGRDLFAADVPAQVSLVSSVFGERAGLFDGDWAWCEEESHPPAAYRVHFPTIEQIAVEQLPKGAAEHYHAIVNDLDRRMRLRHFSRVFANR